MINYFNFLILSGICLLIILFIFVKTLKKMLISKVDRNSILIKLLFLGISIIILGTILVFNVVSTNRVNDYTTMAISNIFIFSITLIFNEFLTI